MHGVDAEHRHNLIYFIAFIVIVIIAVFVGFKVSLSPTELKNFAVYSLWGTPPGAVSCFRMF
jgi:hypothetical protein